jgi:serine/threonine protein kinase
MSDLLKFLSGNSSSATLLVVAIMIFLAVVLAIYVIAFAQGRSVSFWPPTIGQRPTDQKPAEAETTGKSTNLVTKPESATTAVTSAISPIVDRGTILIAASGKQYRITSAYYGGANATIFKAEDHAGTAVIAKLYWRGLMPNSPPWELFQLEQRAAEILTHRNIVKMLDRGLRTGYPFTILEYFAGGTLRDWLRTHDAIPNPDVAAIASQLAEALEYAHSRGIIHRDVKPANVLFESDPNGRVALSDFGIAAILGAEEVNVTAVGQFNGTPAYIAPEILQGAPLGNSADIYAFGIIIYEMLTGKVPFDQHRDPMAIIQAKILTEAPDVRTLRPDIPANVAEFIALTLSRDPKLRPRSARAVVGGISDWLVASGS